MEKERKVWKGFNKEVTQEEGMECKDGRKARSKVGKTTENNIMAIESNNRAEYTKLKMTIKNAYKRQNNRKINEKEI